MKDDWDEIRKQVLDRDEYTCRRCGFVALRGLNDEKLDVHHIIPRAKSFNDNPTNLVALCSKCHRTVENTFKRVGLTNIMRKWVEANHESAAMLKVQQMRDGEWL